MIPRKGNTWLVSLVIVADRTHTKYTEEAGVWQNIGEAGVAEFIIPRENQKRLVCTAPVDDIFFVVLLEQRPA